MLSYPVVCISMSYSFMLVCFASAFLISVLAACCIIRFKPFWVAVLSGAVLIALSMGAYQAYLGFVAIILLMYFINGLIFKPGFDGIGFCVRAIISVLVGGILYYLFVQTSLMIYDLDMAEYRGASGINIGSMLRELPYTIINSYKDFFDFFFTDKIRTNAFGMLPVNALCFFICVLFIADVVRRELKRGSVNGILLVIGFLVIPVAANLIDLIAVGNRINILMSIGISFVMPLMLLLIYRFYVSRRLPRFALIALACLSVYANGTEILNDQISMDYGRDQTMAVADCIYDRLMDVPDIQDKVVFIHGQAADSSIFAHTAWYDSANAYAQYGHFAKDEATNISASWPNILRLRYGNFTNYLFAQDYVTFLKNHEGTLSSMPSLPAVGSVIEIDGVVVVKVGDGR